MITIILVIAVIFLFLRNLWATIIPAIAVPLSLTGTFAVMYLLGYSLDNLSLMGLAIAVGLLWTMRSSCWRTLSATSRRA